MKDRIMRICDIARFYNVGYRQAINKIKLIKDSIGKQRHQVLTRKEFCRYEAITEDELEGI